MLFPLADKAAISKAIPKIMFFSRLRDEIKFSSKEMLNSQLKKDEIRVKNYFYKLSSHRY